MAVVIRLARTGKRNQPHYRIVVADENHRRDGRHTERLGIYNPALKEKALTINQERYQHWLSLGAKPSDSIRTLVKKYAAT